MSRRWMGMAGIGLAIACGPSVTPSDDGLGTTAAAGDDDPAETGTADTAPASSCDRPANTIHARMITGRGTPTIEVLTDSTDDPEPLSCASSIPSCDYHLHRLVPIGTFEAGSFTVAGGTLSHEVESCTCCNGEGGGPDETEETYSFSTGHLELDVADESCIMGSFLVSGSQWIPFVAERCPE